MNTLYNHRPHAFQLTGHDTPVLSPVRVSLELVPFDQSPSLHPLRDGWLSRLVQRLRRYYDSVRLPMFVHRQITSLDLLTRSARHLADKHRLSRFSRRLFLYTLRFFDRAGFGGPSRFRDLRYGLPLPPTVSTPWSKALSRLDGWPVHAFVNASRLTSLPTAHDSRSLWFVTPLPYDSFIHNNLTV
jgi:hypothetical protein